MRALILPKEWQLSGLYKQIVYIPLDYLMRVTSHMDNENSNTRIYGLIGHWIAH